MVPRTFGRTMCLGATTRVSPLTRIPLARGRMRAHLSHGSCSLGRETFRTFLPSPESGSKAHGRTVRTMAKLRSVAPGRLPSLRAAKAARTFSRSSSSLGRAGSLARSVCGGMVFRHPRRSRLRARKELWHWFLRPRGLKRKLRGRSTRRIRKSALETWLSPVSCRSRRGPPSRSYSRTQRRQIWKKKPSAGRRRRSGYLRSDKLRRRRPGSWLRMRPGSERKCWNANLRPRRRPTRKPSEGQRRTKSGWPPSGGQGSQWRSVPHLKRPRPRLHESEWRHRRRRKRPRPKGQSSRRPRKPAMPRRKLKKRRGCAKRNQNDKNGLPLLRRRKTSARPRRKRSGRRRKPPQPHERLRRRHRR
mmetsp:Transcript_34418/g.77784  ORF Transcript_34418/g.77784 Transcript_34418/m.77784 type:complete len:360 (-) Transcript_34418:830-1909(-)